MIEIRRGFFMSEDVLTKPQRLQYFYDRLDEAPHASNHDEAMKLLADTLNGVENEFSGVPYNPEEPGTDGRMYPPNEKFRYTKWERPGVHCYRQTRHATFVADNGAIEIRSRSGMELSETPSYEKPGNDKRKVRDYDPSS
jgi:hypothetical protein